MVVQEAQGSEPIVMETVGQNGEMHQGFEKIWRLSCREQAGRTVSRLSAQQWRERNHEQERVVGRSQVNAIRS